MFRTWAPWWEQVRLCEFETALTLRFLQTQERVAMVCCTTTVITPSKMVSTCPKLANTTLSHKRVPEEGAFTLSVKGPEIVTVGVPFDLSVEVRNRGDKACSGLSLIVDGSDGQEGYVVHEAQRHFLELIWSCYVTSVLHVPRQGRHVELHLCATKGWK